MSNPLANAMSKIFVAFDRDVFDMIPVMWDPINFIFFDPISDKEYDYPWVFNSEQDAIQELPGLIDQELKDLKEKAQDLARSMLLLTVTQYKMLSLPIFYYVDEGAMMIKIASSVGKDTKLMVDVISKEVITQPCNFHDKVEDAMAELDDIRCQRI